MLKILEQLCTPDGVSGYEDGVRAAIAGMCRPYADEMHVDVMGNLIVRKNGKRHDGPCLLLTAHMDEVGFLVAHIEEDGSLRLEACGGFDPRVIPARTVRIGDSGITGIIGSKPHHLLSKEEQERVVQIDEMYVDIGASSAEEAREMVDIGDPVVLESDFQYFGPGNRFIKAKALDDRLGCAIMVHLLREELPLDVMFAFTVQEEIGLRGGAAVGFNLHPDIALILEGSSCADLPSTDDCRRQVRVGQGPVISCMDALTVYDRRLFEGCRKLAQDAHLPWQMRVSLGSSSDAGMIKTQRGGVRVAEIAVPVRGVHTASSSVYVKDIEDTTALVRLFLKALAEGELQ